jgi:methionine sulfoxide reductase heme-binding subunit
VTRAARRVTKGALFVLCLAPLAVLVADAFGGRLGANPIRAAELRTGIWGLTILVVTLSVTPLRRLTGWNALGGYRRMLGLFAFTYICLHFLTWFGIDEFFAIKYIGQDIVKRPYITVGFASFLLLIPLAVTSRASMVRRLGRKWKTLHSLVYLAALGGIVHFVWEVKADTTVPTRYAVVLVALLALRFVPVRRRAAAGRAAPRPTPVGPEAEATPAA